MDHEPTQTQEQTDAEAAHRDNLAELADAQAEYAEKLATAKAEAEAAAAAEAEAAAAWQAEDTRRNELARGITIDQMQRVNIRNGMARDDILRAVGLID